MPKRISSFSRAAWAVLLCLCTLVSGAEAAGAKWVARKTHTAVIYMSDLHVNASVGGTQVQAASLRLLDWADTQPVKPTLFVHGGDLTTEEPADLEPWLATVRARIRFVSCAGNHDAAKEGTETPFTRFKAYFPDETRATGREFYSHRDGNALFLLMSDIVDTTYWYDGNPNDYWQQQFPYENPPSRSFAYWSENGFPEGNPDGTNPDFSGFNTPGSDQWTWALRTIDRSRAFWIIPVMHIPAISPNTPSPYLQRGSFRDGLVEEMVAHGAEVVLQGHIHNNLFSVRMIRNEADPDSGAHFATVSGGFFERYSQAEGMPANTILYTSGNPETLDKTYAMYMEFIGNKWLRVKIAYADFNTGHEEDPVVVVFDTTLTRRSNH